MSSGVIEATTDDTMMDSQLEGHVSSSPISSSTVPNGSSVSNSSSSNSSGSCDAASRTVNPKIIRQNWMTGGRIQILRPLEVTGLKL